MVRKRERSAEPNEQEIHRFANGAEVNPQIPPPTREKKFKRITLSLTEDDDNLINTLSLKVTSFRCNRSQAVKAALSLLAAQSDADIIRLLEEQNDK